jgi:hypothetical protein
MESAALKSLRVFDTFSPPTFHEAGVCTLVKDVICFLRPNLQKPRNPIQRIMLGSFKQILQKREDWILFCLTKIINPYFQFGEIGDFNFIDVLE